ncbi:MAG: hypothetical protein AUK24_01845 [Syntrophaceae bacterium CG2_30_49_12]|nr:MAG: hypothetical protein AUK24_01845 [Syntrophaceae bacterium CG2_30_49_12]PIP04909.1 MAG: hypothetical protein COX52_14980 [Syntrophobacterales bacterium CG23_combo_of_CG06-09_8_20_14_all_48_27]
MKVMRYLVTVVVLFLLTCSFPALAEDGFTKKDRELLIELRVKMGEIDKRFEQVDKRFDQIDKRFEQVDKRFEQVDKRFGDMFNFLYILAGIFTSLVAVVIGFGYWDRRTIIREARREAIEFIEKEGVLRRVLDALRELSLEDNRLANALRRFNLL